MRRWEVSALGRTSTYGLFAGFQILEQVTQEPVYFILGERECVAADGLFSNGAIDQVIGRVLHYIKDDGALAEANVFIAPRRRAQAPSGIAAKRTSHQSWVGAGVYALDGHVAAADGNVKID